MGHGPGRRRSRGGSPGRCPGPEGGRPPADRLARTRGRVHGDRRHRASCRSRGELLLSARTRHRGADRGIAQDQLVRPGSHAGRDRPDRGVSKARSRPTPGCVLRHRVSSRHAPRGPDRADPPAVRGRRGPTLWLPRPVLCVSDGGTGPGRRTGGGPGPCHPGAPRRRGEPGGGPGGPFRRHDHGLHAGLRAGHGDAHRRPRSRPGPVPVAGRGDDGRPVRAVS